MWLVSVFLFASLSNLDNVIVGISYGVKKIHIPLHANLLIALITCAGTVLSMLAGKFISGYAPASLSNTIGAAALIAIGAIGLAKYFINRRKQRRGILDNPEKYDKNNNSRIELKEAVSLALALSANNVGLGLGASVSGLPIIPAATATFIFSFAYIHLGNLFGSSVLSGIIGKHAEPIACTGIMALGLFELLF
jgi:putative sporulation protein YtaF